MSRHPGASTLSEHERRVIAVWAADCAERTLPLFEQAAPNDTRPREAIDRLRAFARGDARIGELRALAARAHAAARDVHDPAAVASARAAGHAAAVAHMAGHALGVVYAALAAGLAHRDNPAATSDEIEWQLAHASPMVREILRRLPQRPAAKTGVNALITTMDQRIRSDP